MARIDGAPTPPRVSAGRYPVTKSLALVRHDVPARRPCPTGLCELPDQAYVDLMRTTPRAVALVMLVGLVALPACGGDDDAVSSDDDQSSESSESTPEADDVREPTGTDDETGTEGDTDADQTDADETDADTAGGPSGGDVTCDGIFGSAEMEDWFGELAEMTEETTESIGQLVCNWQTIEDPDDLEDLAVSLVTAQVFSGDPVPAENFIDPDIFEDVTMLEGFGDVAFYTDEIGGGFYFYDDPVAGTLTFADMNFGDADAPALHTLDERQELFRIFHERVTG